MDIGYLQRVKLFDGLNEHELASIAAGAKLRSFPKTAVVITQGDESNTLYVVVEGKLKVYMSDEEGKEVILAFLPKGDYFGELALLDAAPRMASVMAVEPSQLGIIPGAYFLNCLRDNPQIGINLMATLARRMRSLADNVSSLALMDVYGRVAQVLLRESHEEEGQRVMERLTHQEIANMVGASREMVSKVLKDLKIGGYLEVDHRNIVIKERLPARW